jgi:hypothetical protein
MGTGRVILCFVFLVSNCVYAAGDHAVTGGRAAALGYTSVTQSDEWSVFNNQAGLAWCKRFSTGIYCENRFFLEDLSGKALALTLPVGKGAFGVSFYQFGFSLYSELNTGLAYGMHLTRRFSAGVKVDYLHLHVADGFKDNSVFSCETGLQFRASDHLWLGLHIANPVPVKFSPTATDRLPTLMRFGISWRISEGLHCDAEVEKDLILKPSLKGGIEYRPVKSFSIRVGFLTNPATFTFGFGLEFGSLHFDLASSYNLILGYSPQASVVYFFGKGKD